MQRRAVHRVLKIGALRHTTIAANGIRFHIAEKGDGPLALLLHGFPECWYSWRFQLDALAAAGYRAVAPDLRGYGGTDAPRSGYDLRTLVADVRSLVEALGASKPHIIGHDWGGLIAWSYAQSHPDTIDKLVIMDAPHPQSILSARGLFDLKQIKRSWYIFWFQVPYFPERKLAKHARGFLRAALRGTAIRKENFSDADLAVFEEVMSRDVGAKLAYYRQLFRKMPTVLRDGQRPIGAPTLVIWGADDPFVGVQMTEPMHKLGIRDLRIEIIERASHFVQQEAPEEVNRLVVAHLQRH